MLAHLLNAAVRSLAVTVVLGSILIYAPGGLDSPNARAMIGVIAICFFLFWITFFSCSARACRSTIQGAKTATWMRPARSHSGCARGVTARTARPVSTVAKAGDD